MTAPHTYNGKNRDGDSLLTTSDRPSRLQSRKLEGILDKHLLNLIHRADTGVWIWNTKHLLGLIVLITCCMGSMCVRNLAIVLFVFMRACGFWAKMLG